MNGFQTFKLVCPEADDRQRQLTLRCRLSRQSKFQVKSPPAESPLKRPKLASITSADATAVSLPLRLDHGPDNTLQVRDYRSAVLGDIKLDSLPLIPCGSVVRDEIESVVAAGSKQDSGADLAIFPILRQTEPH